MQEQNQQSSSSKNDASQFGNGANKGGDKGRAGQPLGTQSGGEEGVLEAAKSTSMDLLEKARSTAGEAYGTVTEKATSKLEEGKVGLSGGLSSVAGSIRKVADGIKESPETGTVADYSAKYAESAAQKLESVAGYFEHQDLATIARDVESYARRNTAIFLGVAFAAGILAARFIKSSPSGTTGELSNAGMKSSGGNTRGALSSGSNVEPIGRSTGVTGSSTGAETKTGSSDPGLESSARGV